MSEPATSMRQLEVIHETVYAYSAPVEHAHHWLRLRPLDGPLQRVLASEVTVGPQPLRRSERRDADGVHELRFELDVPHDELVIVARSRVALLPRTPPQGIDLPWEAAAARLRYEAGADYRPEAAFVTSSPLAARHPEIRDWALASFPPGRPLREACIDLMRRVHDGLRFDPEATGVGTTAIDVLRLGRGVCQDFAHLSIAALRSLGLAARYVSGYLLTTPPPGRPRLVGADASHAWVSAWCPQAGWFEFDPTNDRAPGDDYVTLARGRDYADVAPVRGVIRGGGAHAVRVAVTVRDLDEEGQGTGGAPDEAPDGRDVPAPC